MVVLLNFGNYEAKENDVVLGSTNFGAGSTGSIDGCTRYYPSGTMVPQPAILSYKFPLFPLLILFQTGCFLH